MNHFSRESAVQSLLSKMINDGGITPDKAVLEMLNAVRKQLIAHNFYGVDKRTKEGKVISKADALYAEGVNSIFNALRDLEELK